MKLGLYVHIPFCKAKCLYCDFNSYAGMSDLHDRYTKALCKEIQSTNISYEVDSIYIGGGTPTAILNKNLLAVIQSLKENFVLSEDCEITVECNPATIDKEGLDSLYHAGVNRLSIGLQSANQKELTRLGRIHTLEDFAHCMESARFAGFQNISLDLMYGLPEQKLSDWARSLEVAVSFSPEHISCYALKLEEGTPLYEAKTVLPDDDTVREYYDYGAAFLHQHGYHRYEVSNFAGNGKESRHNCKYWKCEDYLGFGAGAYSCYQNHRFSNLKPVKAYCQRIENGDSVTEENIFVTPDDAMREFCFLGLRMVDGISISEFDQRFQKSIFDVFGDTIEKNLRRGTLLRLDDRIVIPETWIFVNNSILVDFI